MDKPKSQMAEVAKSLQRLGEMLPARDEEPTDAEMLDWLDNSKMGSERGYFVWFDGAVGLVPLGGQSIRDAIREAMKGEARTR